MRKLIVILALALPLTGMGVPPASQPGRPLNVDSSGNVLPGIDLTWNHAQKIDMGSIGNTIVEGLVMRNDTHGTNAVQLQNAPVINFEAHGWDGAADHKWEMNEQFFTYASGAKSKFLWQFYENDGAPGGDVYIDSSGSIGALGYITAGATFGFIAGNGLFNQSVLTLCSVTAAISNTNTTVPLKFNSSNTTVNAWRFTAASTLTSGNFIEGLVPNSGFTGDYLKLGQSSNGTSITTTMFEVNASGQVATSTSISARAFNSAAISVPNNTLTGLPFDSESWDTDTIHSTSSNTGRLTAKTAGVYQICATIEFAPNGSGSRLFSFRINGSTRIGDASFAADSNVGATTNCAACTQYLLSANDYVELMIFQNSGGALNINRNASWSPEFMMTRLP